MNIDPYAALGLLPSASAGDVQRAFHNIARNLQPDVKLKDANAETRFKEVCSAYKIIRDSEIQAWFNDEPRYFQEPEQQDGSESLPPAVSNLESLNHPTIEAINPQSSKKFGGTIARLKDQGYGFIQSKELQRDVFFHANVLEDVTFEELREGDSINFDIVDGPKGPNAAYVGRNGVNTQESREQENKRTREQENKRKFQLIHCRIK